MEQAFIRVDDYRIDKTANAEDKRTLWRLDIDGSWVFKRAMNDLEAAAFIVTKMPVGEDRKYDYWR